MDGLVAHPAEGRWGDTHRDNENLAQGTVTLQVRLAGRDGEPLPDSGRDRRGAAPPRLAGNAAAVRARLPGR